MMYVFGKNINGTNETGIVRLGGGIPELICLCDEAQSKLLLQALNISSRQGVGGSSMYELTVIEGLTEAQAGRIKKHWHEYLPTVELNVYEGYSEKENRFRCTIKIKRDATHISLILLGKLLRGVEDKSICP